MLLKATQLQKIYIMLLQMKINSWLRFMTNVVSKKTAQPQREIWNGNIYKRLMSSSSMSVVDLRSDTLTKPTLKMREAMKNAEVGDDVYGEDPTVRKLQEKMADMFGKEASLFVPTCTMANTIATLVHCDGRFNEIIIGNLSHMFLYEVGVIGALAGVSSCGVPNQPDGTMDLDHIESAIRPLDDVHQPWTRVICLENTQNKCGGKALNLHYMKSVRHIADRHNVKLHLDGARVFNAATALGVPVSEITKHCDTVSTAFSKGLCGPAGSIIAGSHDFIRSSKRARKALGGGMRQVGVLAAPILETIDDQIKRLWEDHDRARKIAEAVNKLKGNPVCSIEMDGVHSNIVMIDIIDPFSPKIFSERMAEVSDIEKKLLGESISVLMLPFSATRVRYVLHNDINDEDVEKVIKKIEYVIEELSEK